MTDWRELEWLCIDTETTGLDADTDRIVELAALRFCGGEVLGQQTELLDPGMPIPAAATAVHGIGDAQVAGHPRLEQIADGLLAQLGAAEVLVGYNWPFDAGFLAAGLGARWQQAIAAKPIIDALVLVRFGEVGRYWKGRGRHQLGAVAARLGLVRQGQAHRALSDCELTCRILWKLRHHLPAEPRRAAALIAERRQEQEREYRRWRRSREHRRN